MDFLKKEMQNLPNEILHQIMDEEAEKPVEEIDTALIELCSEILLTQQERTKQLPKIKKKSVQRLVVIAASLSVLFLSVLFVSAGVQHLKLEHTAATTEGDKIMVNTANNRTVPDGYQLADTALVQDYQAQGFLQLTLPEVFVDGTYRVTGMKDITPEGSALTRTVLTTLEKEEIRVDLILTQMQIESSPKTTLLNAVSVEELMVNGLDVLLVEYEDFFEILYYDSTQFVEYHIRVQGGYKEARRIVKSIK